MTRFRYWLADLISGGELKRAFVALEREINYSTNLKRIAEEALK